MTFLQVLSEQLTAPEYTYDTGLRDQNAIVYLLKKHWPEMKSKLQLVNKQYCLNCYWRDLMAMGDIKSSEKRVGLPLSPSLCTISGSASGLVQDTQIPDTKCSRGAPVFSSDLQLCEAEGFGLAVNLLCGLLKEFQRQVTNGSCPMQVQFVNHFSGCQMCLDLNKNGDMPECEREYIKSFEYANSVMMKLLARKPPRNVSMHDAILASFYCQVRSAAMHMHSATSSAIRQTRWQRWKQDWPGLLHSGLCLIQIELTGSASSCI